MRGSIHQVDIHVTAFYMTKGGAKTAPKRKQEDFKFRTVITTDGNDSKIGVQNAKPSYARLKMQVRGMLTPAKAERFLDIDIKSVNFITYLGKTMYDIDDPNQMKYLKNI